MTENTIIFIDDDNNKIFKHTIDGKTYSFNVDYLPEEWHSWFCKVVGNIMNEIHTSATINAEKNFINRFKTLLELA